MRFVFIVYQHITHEYTHDFYIKGGIVVMNGDRTHLHDIITLHIIGTKNIHYTLYLKSILEVTK